MSGMILFDLTTSLMTVGPPTGIARVEYDFYSALMEVTPARIVPIVWNRKSGNFIQLPLGWRAEPIAPDLLGAMEADGRAPPLEKPVGPNSQILTVGGTWARRTSYIEALAHARLRGAAHVTVLVHDLAQIRLPELYPKTAAVFERHARRLLEVADRVLVYSEATRSDVASLLADAALSKPIAKFRMGSTLDAAPAGRGELQPVPAGLEVCAGRRIVLYVSSIEPRKNHLMLIAAWRRLVGAYGQSAPMLLCVGRPVMDGKKLIDDVRADPAINRHVHFATGLADADLDWCYRNAAFTVYPSLYEGWGLPIAESLLYGKLCIASNASSMREVAPHLTDLLDPADVASWAERISFYLNHPDDLSVREERIRNEYVSYPWQSAGQEVLDVMNALPSLTPPTAYVQPFTSLKFIGPDRSPLGGEVLGTGWSPSRKGRVTTGSESDIALTYLGTRRFALRLWFSPEAGIGGMKVTVDQGTIQTRVNRGANYIDLIIERSQHLGETQLRLLHKPGLILTAIDVADTGEDLDRLHPSRTAWGASMLRGLVASLRARPGR